MSNLIDRLDIVLGGTHPFEDSDIAYEFSKAYPKLRAVVLAAQNVQLVLKPNPERINNVQTRLEAIEAINELTDTLEAMDEDV